MREVAERAGVALSTVSRVLSGHPDVSESMRERVHAAVAELGYQPNFLARSLRRQETLTVGFVVADISNPLFAEIAKAAETALRDAGYLMLLTNSESDPELDAAHIQLFDQRRVDGLILSLAREGHGPTLDLLRELELPLVVLDREVGPEVGASRVLSDHRTGMRAALRHLVELGHRRIGVVLGQPVRATLERRAAIVESADELGLPADAIRVLETGGYDAEATWAALAALLDASAPPTAIVVGANPVVASALVELSRRGIAVGRDLSVVACDEVDVNVVHQPPVAVVRRDTAEIGRVAAALLLERLRGEPPRDVVLPTEFLPRASCGPPRA